MGFWPRLTCAVVCWFLTALVLFTIADYCLPPVPTHMSLLMKLLQVLAAGIVIIVALIGTLALWLWVWVRNA